MGDRVLMQVVSDKEVGPIAYGHWHGAYAHETVRRLAKRMESRGDDVSYASARLIQEMCGDDDRNLSFGVWNAKKALTAKDSHGDAGVILIHADKGYTCTCIGGYLKVGADGFPIEPK